MKCRILFSRKSKKNIISLSSAESAHSMVSVNILIPLYLTIPILKFKQFVLLSVLSKLLGEQTATTQIRRRVLRRLIGSTLFALVRLPEHRKKHNKKTKRYLDLSLQSIASGNK